MKKYFFVTWNSKDGYNVVSHVCEDIKHFGTTVSTMNAIPDFLSGAYTTEKQAYKAALKHAWLIIQLSKKAA